MTEALETFAVDKVTVKIYPDEFDHDCPVDEYLKRDGVWFVTFQKRSTLSNQHNFSSPDDVLLWAEEYEWATFPLFYYEHGLCAYSVSESGNPFHCPWDSGQVGWVLLKKSDFPDESKRLEVAQSWANAVTTWCNGAYYGYAVENEDGDTLDSCWGYDDIDYCKQEATDAAKHHAEKLVEKMKVSQEEAYNDMYGQLG